MIAVATRLLARERESFDRLVGIGVIGLEGKVLERGRAHGQLSALVGLEAGVFIDRARGGAGAGARIQGLDAGRSGNGLDGVGQAAVEVI